MRTSMINATLLATVATAILTLGLAAITSSYNLVGVVHAADKNQFCYHHPLNQQRECFDNNGACIKAQRNDPLADSGCQKF